MKKTYVLAALMLISLTSFAQGTLSGDLMANVNFFRRDSAINAANNPLYDNYLSGGESWLSLRYNNGGFTATMRVDAFQNSNLYNPTAALSGFGIGAWSVSQEINKFTITGGYIYDQIGSGILFRSYEDRGLLIDNALVGLRLKYDINDNLFVKAFAGQQKFLFTRYNPIIKAFNVEGSYDVGKKVHIIPGIGVLNRTLDQGAMDLIVPAIQAQDTLTYFNPKYNTYAFTLYNTLTAGDFSWYVEGSYKTEDVIVKDNRLQNPAGNVLYSTLGYARKGFAVNFTGKRTENYVMRTSPNEVLIRGLMNWQPIVARLRPQRLMARYTPASQDISELALGSDVLISPNDELEMTLNYTHINSLEGVKLYREAYAEAEYRGINNVILHGGVQYLEYNQELYQVKPAVPMLKAITPFAEITYRFNDKQSIRTEWEYQHTEQDFGSWVFGLIEYNIAPSWSFAVSDMYNVSPGPSATAGAQHYYNVFTAYNKGPHRFTGSFVKQVEGINCTGGVCRYEPAFSGFRFGVTSSF